MLQLSRPHVRIPRYLIDPRTEEELAAEEARIEAEGDNGTFIPDLTLKDVNTLEQLDSEEFTLDQLKELAEREDVVGEAIAGKVCEIIPTSIDLVRRALGTTRGKVADAALKQVLPELFARCGRKPQVVRDRDCKLTINAARSSLRLGGERTIPAESDQFQERAKSRDIEMDELNRMFLEQISTVIDWMDNVPDTTRGKVAGAVIGRKLPEFFAFSDRRPTSRRECQIANSVYMAVSERAFRDKTLSMGIRGKGATRLLLARWHAFEDKYQKAKVNVHCCVGQWLSWREMLVIVVYERGDPSEIFERILWSGIKFNYSSEATLERDYPGLAGFIDRQRNGAPDENGAYNGRMLPRGGSLHAALKAVCQRDWLKTVTPNLQKNGSLQQLSAIPATTEPKC
jgi:hypothetical protein